MTYDQIFSEWSGRGCDTDGQYGNQCKDWANEFAKEIGHPLPAGNAIDMAGRNIAGYQWIPNTPSAVPMKGDSIVWGAQVGPFGHIADCFDANPYTFRSYDQNFPLQEDANGNGIGVVHLQNHNYNGVLGWHRPTNPPPEEQQVATDQELQAKNDEIANLKTAVAEKDTEIDNLKAEVQDLHNQIVELQKTASEQSPATPPKALTLQDVIQYFVQLFKR